MKMNPVVHFELPAADSIRMADFYSKAFGWKQQRLGEDMGGYIVVQTSENDEKGMIKNPGMINGGIYKESKEMVNPAPSVVIAVDDVKAHVKIVEDAGGKVMGEPMDIPGVGKYVAFRDPEGNMLSMLQPSMKPPSGK